MSRSKSMISNSYIVRRIWAITFPVLLQFAFVAGPAAPSQALSLPPSSLSILPAWGRIEQDRASQSSINVVQASRGIQDLPTASAIRSRASYAMLGPDAKERSGPPPRGQQLGVDLAWHSIRPLGPYNYECYRDVDSLYATLELIETNYPVLTELTDYGDSWCKENSPSCVDNEQGYDLKMLKITNSQIDVPKPRFFLMSNIHARELVTPEIAMHFIEYLLDSYGTDPDATWIVDYHEIYVVVTANPDGRQLVEGDPPNPGCKQRKNRNDTLGSCQLCDLSGNNQYGVDLNRNFPYHWGGASNQPCDYDYQGDAAGSEPETQALTDTIGALFVDQREDNDASRAPDDTTGLLISLHSHGNLVLWPWGWTTDEAPNHVQMQTLGRKFAYFNNYTPEQASEYYPATGITDDWAYGVLGIPAYTFEIGEAHFQSCDDLDELIDENMGALLYAAKVPRTPYLTSRGPDSLDLGVTPITPTVGETAQLTAALNDSRYNNSNGTEPTQNIVSAEYYIDTPPWITTTMPISYPMMAADGSFDETIEVVTATVDTTGMSRGRHTLFVRGRDADGNWGAFSAVFLWVGDPISITVAPNPVTITAGTTQVFTATGYDQYGYPMPIAPTWTTNGGTVSPTSGVTAVFTAQTTAADGQLITATQGTTSGTAAIHVVHDSVTAIEATPAATISAAGEPQSYTVTARDTYSNTWDVTPISMYTITPGASGEWTNNVYTGEIAGTWTITAAYLGLTDTAALTVTHATTAISITISPAQHTVEAGEQVTYTLIATDTYGNFWDASAIGNYTTTPGADGVWTNNVYTAEIAGTWTVAVAYLGLTRTAALTVTHVPTPTHIVLSPTHHTVEVDNRVTYTLAAIDAYSNSWDVTANGDYTVTPGASGVWTNNVYYVGEIAGIWAVTATYLGLTDTAALTVTHAPAAGSVGLSPAHHTIQAGEQVAYTLIATDTYGNSWNATAGGHYTITPAAGGTWASNIYTAEIAGVWTVTTVYLGLTDTAVLTVTHAPTAISAILSPNPHSIGSGGQVTYTLIATDTHGNSWNATAGGNYTITPAAGGSWMGNVYTSQHLGTWSVTGTIPSAVASAILTVTTAPAVSFTRVPTGVVCIETTVQFIDTSTRNPAAWAWAFGDGSVAYTQHPTHSYAATGTFTVTLVSTNSYGSGSANGTIQAISAPSVAIAQVPAGSLCLPGSVIIPGGSVCLGANVVFSATNSGGPASYRWSFGDTVAATGQYTSHAYVAPGTYTVWLTATNGCGTDVVSTTVVVVAHPLASFVRNPVGDVPVSTTVHFTDTSTGEPTAWVWNFGDGTVSTQQHPDHIYAATGAYTVTLTVTQACGSDIAACTIVVVPGSLGTVITALTSDSPKASGHTMHFTAVVTGDTPITYTWDFGDGTSPMIDIDLAATSHIYTSGGVYTVNLTTSNRFDSDSAVLRVTALWPAYLPFMIRGGKPLPPPPSTLAAYLARMERQETLVLTPSYSTVPIVKTCCRPSN
jgi:carboxypeptidase T